MLSKLIAKFARITGIAVLVGGLIVGIWGTTTPAYAQTAQMAVKEGTPGALIPASSLSAIDASSQSYDIYDGDTSVHPSPNGSVIVAELPSSNNDGGRLNYSTDAAYAVQLTGGSGGYYAIGNEPDVVSSDDTPPASYATVLHTWITDIRALDSTAHFIGPNITGWASNQQVFAAAGGIPDPSYVDGSPTQWFTDMMASYKQQYGAYPPFTALSLHNYTTSEMDMQYPIQPLVQMISNFSAAAVSYGYPAKIWITEGGMMFNQSASQTLSTNQENLVTAFTEILLTNSDVSREYYFQGAEPAQAGSFSERFPLDQSNSFSTTEVGTALLAAVNGATGGHPTSTTTVSCSPNPVGTGSDTTCTATVTGSGAVPTGTVIFGDGRNGGTFSSPSPSGGVDSPGSDAYCNLPGTSPNTCTVTYTNPSGPQVFNVGGTYSGSSSYQPSNGQTVLTIGTDYTSTTTVSCSPNPVAVGSQTTCTATVTGSGALPTGAVLFSDGGVNGTFSNPQPSGGSGPGPDVYCKLPGTTPDSCSVTYTNATAQTVTISGFYVDRSNLHLSSTGTTQLTVGSGSNPTSTTTVSCSPNPVTAGSSTTCAATVAGSGALPQGTVTFNDGGANGTLSSTYCTLPGTSPDKCSVTYSNATAQTVTLSSTYNPSTSQSPTYQTSSGQTQLTVSGSGGGATSTTTVSCSPNSVATGTNTTCTATVTGSGALPTGTVYFSDGLAYGTFANPSPSGSGGTSLGYCTLPGTSPDSCSLTYKNSTAQFIAVTATYSVSANSIPYQESSGQTRLTVGGGAGTGTSTTTVSCSPNPVTAGSSTVCTATVTGSGTLPQGNVGFDDGGAGGTFSNPQPGGDAGPGSDENCYLPGSSPDKCSVTYTNSTAQFVAVTATYSANVSETPYPESTAQTQLTVGGNAGGATSTTTVSCSPNSVATGTNTTCTATVTGSGALPTGTVYFSDGLAYGTFANPSPSGSGGTSLGHCNLPGTSPDTCSLTYKNSTAQFIAVTGTYSVSTNSTPYPESSGQTRLTVGGGTGTGTSTTTVSCSPNPVTAGSSTVCTATVTGSGTLPQGNVGFDDGGAGGTFSNPQPGGDAGPGSDENCYLPGSSPDKCSVTYTNSTAQFVAVTATYSANVSETPYPESTAQTQLTVGSGGGSPTSQTTVSCAPNSVATSTNTTCTATVTGSSALPTGTVYFSDGLAYGTFANPSPSGSGGTSLGHCTLSPGRSSSTCSLTYKNSTAQFIAVTGTYSVSTNSTPYPESSGQTRLTVGGGTGTGTSTTTVSCSPNPVTAGSSTVCTATVTGSGTLPEGNVGFDDGGAGGTFSNPQLGGDAGPGSDENCYLTPGSSSSTCSVTYTNSTAQMVAVTGTYSASTSTPYPESTSQTQLTVH